MTPEERERWDRIDRHMEAAARNHEQLSADLAALNARTDRNEARIAEQGARFDARMEQLRREVAHEFEQVAGLISELGGIAKRTLERLDAVIVVLERHLANGET